MTLVLLDTNTYLRLAKRIRPMLGVPFGQKEYVVTVLKDVADEVHRSSALKFKFPWFDGKEFVVERAASSVRLSADEKSKLDNAQSVLFGWVRQDIKKYTTMGRAPPSDVDCRVLAFGQIRDAVVVTDDLGMHALAEEFAISIWHGYELLAKMNAAKVVNGPLIRKIYEALEANGDLTSSWVNAKHTTFVKIFGKVPADKG